MVEQKAEGEGFEPSSDLTARNGFRDRRIRPLCHPSEGRRVAQPFPVPILGFLAHRWPCAGRGAELDARPAGRSAASDARRPRSPAPPGGRGRRPGKRETEKEGFEPSKEE